MSKATFKTARGIAVYPWLNRPDVQFDADGVFKVSVRLSKDAAEPLIAKAKQEAEKAFGAKAKSAKLPFKQDEETGDVLVVTKSKYQPIVKDSRNREIPPHLVPNIFGGSELVASGSMNPYEMGGSRGISLRLSAVQLIKLAANSGGADVQFDTVEDGFVMEEYNDNAVTETAEEEGDYNF